MRMTRGKTVEIEATGLEHTAIELTAQDDPRDARFYEGAREARARLEAMTPDERAQGV